MIGPLSSKPIFVGVRARLAIRTGLLRWALGAHILVGVIAEGLALELIGTGLGLRHDDGARGLAGLNV